MALVAEWLEKAEQDYKAMEALWACGQDLWDGVGFHAQQCIEKYLKAILALHKQPVPKTHHLRVLLTQHVLPLEPVLQDLDTEALLLLTYGSVEARYPGVTLNEAMASRLRETCHAMRSRLRNLLNLDV